MSAWNDGPAVAGIDGDRRRRSYDGEEHGRAQFFTVVLALATFVTVAALSARQLSAPGNATRLLAGGIAAVVDIDRYLAHDLQEAATSSQADGALAVRLPGYPLDVLVMPEELRGDPEELRQAVLERSASLVYVNGISAFDATGNQSLSLVSWENLLRIAVGQVNQTNHERAGWVGLIGGMTMALTVVALVLRPQPLSGYRAVGGAIFVGALPGLVLALAARGLAGQFGSDSDPIASDLREVMQSGFEVPMRNFAIAAGAGALVGLIGIGVVIGERWVWRQ